MHPSSVHLTSRGKRPVGLTGPGKGSSPCAHHWWGLTVFTFGPLTHYRKDTELLECVQRNTMELVKSLKHESCEEWLREVFRLERRSLRDFPITLYNCLKGGCSQLWVSLFSLTGGQEMASSYITGGLEWILRRISLWKEIFESLLKIATCCPGLNPRS